MVAAQNEFMRTNSTACGMSAAPGQETTGALEVLAELTTYCIDKGSRSEVREVTAHLPRDHTWTTQCSEGLNQKL